MFIFKPQGANDFLMETLCKMVQTEWNWKDKYVQREEVKLDLRWYDDNEVDFRNITKVNL